MHRWLLVTLVAVWVSGCSQISDLPIKLPERRKGLTFTVGLLGRPQTALSLVAPTAQEAEVTAMLYRPLWDYDTTWQVVPVMAEAPPRFTFRSDGRAVETRLAQPAFHWSSQEPVQPNDFRTAQQLSSSSPPSGRARPLWSHSVASLNISQDSVRFQLQGFWPVGGLSIIPFPNSAAPLLKEDPMGEYGHAPWSNGPFKVKSWEGDGRLITLVPNPDYPWPAGSQPLPQIRFRFYDHPDRLVRAILAGDLQLIPKVPAEVLAGARDNPWTQPRWVASDRLQTLFLRMDSPLLSEVAVRRALFAGLRRAQWVPKLHPGAYVHPARSWVPQRAWFFLDVLEEVPNPNQVLEAAGWKGQPVRAKGRLSLKLELLYAQDSATAPAVIERIQERWSELGVEIQPMPVQDLEQRLKRRDFSHLALVELPLQPWFSPAQLMGRTGLPSEENPLAYNYSGWVDDENEAICSAVERAADQVELKPLLARQQKHFAQELPFFPLYFVPDVHLVSPNLTGYQPRGFGAACFNSQTWSYTPPPAGGSPSSEQSSSPALSPSPEHSPSPALSPSSVASPSPEHSTSPALSPSSVASPSTEHSTSPALSPSPQVSPSP
jgi:hypothetical protein